MLTKHFLLPLQQTIAVTVVMIFAALPLEASGPRYWIDESTDFTGNGCENTDLNNVTSSLKSRLDSDGWTGRYPVVQC